MSVLYQVIIRSFAFCRQVGYPKGFNDRSIIAIVLPDPFIGNTHYQCKCVIFTQNTPVKPKITADREPAADSFPGTGHQNKNQIVHD